MGGAVWLDSRETAGGRQQSASAKAGFDPSRPLPSPLSPTRLQEERQLGSKVWEGYGEGEGRTSLNPGRRREPRVERAPAGTSQTGEPYSHLLLGKQAQKGSSNGFITQAADLLISHLALTPACPTLDALYVSPGVGRHGKFQFWAL